MTSGCDRRENNDKETKKIEMGTREKEGLTKRSECVIEVRHHNSQGHIATQE